MDNGKIGYYIAQCRKKKGMTQQQLADALGITNKAVSKWETGHGMPDISVLSALAEILGVSVDSILSEKKVIRLNNEYSIEASQNDVTEYLVNKSIIKFKTRVVLWFWILLPEYL